MYPDEYVTTKSKFPTQPHWVIMLFTQTHVPGDERSRTNPGHGYAAHTTHHADYQAYLTEEKFLAALEDMEDRGFASDRYVAFKVEPLTVTKTVSVSVD